MRATEYQTEAKVDHISEILTCVQGKHQGSQVTHRVPYKRVSESRNQHHYYGGES